MNFLAELLAGTAGRAKVDRQMRPIKLAISALLAGGIAATMAASM